MRKSTLITASVATLSALYVAQNLAVANQPQPLVMVTAEDSSQAPAAEPSVDSPASIDTEVVENAPNSEQPAQSTKAPTDSAPAESAPAETNETTASKEPSPADTQPQPEPVPEPEPEVVQPQTVASDVVEYQYGVIQLELTHQAGTIMNVSVLQGDTSYGRGDTYAALINATVAAQGTNFGNYSGATFTTEAFRDAVASATAKF